MGFKEDITHIFSEVLRQHGGNKAAAAESLGVNTVTFWGWVEGKRTPNTEALAPLLDKVGARLILPGETIENQVVSQSKNAGLEAEVARLRRKLEEAQGEYFELNIKYQDTNDELHDAYREMIGLSKIKRNKREEEPRQLREEPHPYPGSGGKKLLQ